MIFGTHETGAHLRASAIQWIAIGAVLTAGLGAMAGLDAAIARRLVALLANPAIAEGLHLLQTRPEVKGLVPMAAVWWLWSRSPTDVGWGRRLVDPLTVLTVAFAAIAVGRVLANGLPFRPRPRSDPAIMGEAVDAAFVADWSSMPSDHAMLFTAMAVAIAAAAPRVGTWLLVHAVLLVMLPRMLALTHFLSDLLVGAAIGAAVALVLRGPVRARLGPWLARLDTGTTQVPPWVLPLLFVATFETALMFDGVRLAVRLLAQTIM